MFHFQWKMFMRDLFFFFFFQFSEFGTFVQLSLVMEYPVVHSLVLCYAKNNHKVWKLQCVEQQ